MGGSCAYFPRPTLTLAVMNVVTSRYRLFLYWNMLVDADRHDKQCFITETKQQLY